MDTLSHPFSEQATVIAWILVLCSSLAAGFALFFLFVIRYTFFKGLAWALLLGGACGALHAAGILRTKLVADAYPSLTLLGEALNCARNFTYTAAITCFIGFFLYLGLRRTEIRFWRGFGLGLCIMGLVLAGLLAAEVIDLENAITHHHSGIHAPHETLQKN